MPNLYLHHQTTKAIDHTMALKNKHCYEEKNFAMRMGAWTICLS